MQQLILIHPLGVEIRGTRLTPKMYARHRNVGGFWCDCSCGNKTFASTRELNDGKRESCGCARIERNTHTEEHVKQTLLTRTKKTEQGCWVCDWAHKQKYKYKYVNFRKTRWLAHRASWTVFKGEIPEGLCVLHKCDNPPCVNPEHLFLGTKKDNAQDRSRKGRNWNCKGERNPNAKLTPATVVKIRELLSAGLTTRAVAKVFDTDPATIWRIGKGQRWSSVPK